LILRQKMRNIVSYIKYFLFTGLTFFIIVVIAVNITRRPSYTIKTNGKLYIVNKLSSSITVFDLFEGKELLELPIKIEPHEATTSENQESVIVTNYGTPKKAGKSISIINTLSNTVKKTITFEKNLKPHGIVAFPKTNKVGVVSNIGNKLLVINLESDTIEKSIATNQLGSHLLVLHPNKPLAFISNISSGSVSVIDLVNDTVIKNIPCGKGTQGIDITPDGNQIWVSNTKENTLSVINTNTLKITDIIQTGKEPLRLKFSIDGNYCFVTNSGDGIISVYNSHLKTLIKKITIPGKKGFIQRTLYHTPRPGNILMHPNGLYAFVANSNANKIEVIDMQTFALVSTIGTGKVPDGLTFVE